LEYPNIVRREAIILKQIPPYLFAVLRLLAQGYSHRAVAQQLVTTPKSVSEYCRRLRELLADEPELQNNNISPDTALVLIGQRYFSLLISQDTIDFLTEYADRIYQTRIRGDAYLAIAMADDITRLLAKENSANQMHQNSLLSLQVKILSEQALAYREIVSLDSPLLTNTPIAKELLTIANESGDTEPVGLAYASLAQSYYLDQKYEFAIQQAEYGLDYLKDVHDQLILRRTLALSYAYLHMKKEFQQEENSIRNLIEQGQWSHAECVCTSYEGIARAQGILRLPHALDILKEADEIYTGMSAGNNRMPFRGIQLVRSRLEIAYHLQPNDIQSLEEIGTNGVNSAKEFGYPKYATYIEQFLEQALS
jgi:hypothetical protein